MTTDLLRAVLAHIGADNPDTLRQLRAACPDLASQCMDLLTGELAPCAMIGPSEPERVYGRFDRNAIDASAEREGIAADTLSDWELSRPRMSGRPLSQWDYLRSLRRQWLRDDPMGKCPFRPRHNFAKRSAELAWAQITADFATDLDWRKYVWRQDWRPAWSRDESPERREARKLTRAARQIIRLIGALAQTGNPQARELYRKLQRSGASSRKRK